MKRIIFIVIIFLFSIHLTSDEMKKHPGWAIVTSAVLPGGGQFYAESYVRGIFFSTLQISLISLTVYEKVQERDYWKLYNENHEQDTWHKFNKHKSRVRNLLWWDAGIWFLSCADAFADAHFYGFNENVGVSIQLKREQENSKVEFVFRF